MDEATEILKAIELCECLSSYLQDDIDMVPGFLRGSPAEEYIEGTKLALNQVEKLKNELHTLYYEKSV